MHRARLPLIVSTAAFTAAAVIATSVDVATARPDTAAGTVIDLEFVGQAILPTGTMFEGTEVGGLSSVSFDARRGVYEVIADDQGNRPTGDPVRTYTMKLDLSGATFDASDVQFVDVTELLDVGGAAYPPGGLDPEGLTLNGEGGLFVSSEGIATASPPIDPFIRRYNRTGRVTAELPIPGKFLPDGVSRGVRLNLGFESLNPTPNGRWLVTAAEGALVQDVPPSTATSGSRARILLFDIARRQPGPEYVYDVAPWAEPSSIFGVNGIAEVLPLDDAGTMLVMERSFSVGGVLGGGTGNVIVINEVSTAGATDVSGLDSLAGAPGIVPVIQREVFAFDDLGIPIDNIEGMTFGPVLPDGRQSIVIVSDNNFAPTQFTQIIVLAAEIASAD